jgi:TRAP transporter 4TM/12TM fusion protein
MPEDWNQRLQNITASVDMGGKQRRLGKGWKSILVILTLFGVVYSIDEIFRLGVVFHELVYYYTLVGIFLSISFLLYPATKKAPRDRVPWYDVLLFLLVIACSAYLASSAFRIANEGWVYLGPTTSIVVSLLMWVLVLEALRRSGGLFLLGFVVFFSIYPLVAEHMPGFLEGTGWSLTGAAKFHAMSRESIIGIPTRTFCELVIGFILFGITLQETGGSLFFTKLAYAVFGGVRGGPAKVSVVASSLFGTISGSAVSNVLVDGYITIPTMIRSGYDPPFAAAVEACASSGGCIMPPIMGAVAFVMASFLMVPYADVALAALVPACLYYWGLFVQIDGYAARKGLVGLPRNELPSLKETMKEGWVYLFSIAALLVLLFYLRQEAQAPFYASGLLIIGAFLRKGTRPTPKTVSNLMTNSGNVLAELVVIMSGVGLIIGGLTMTGVALAFSGELVRAVGNNAIVILLAGAIVSFILGMGMTITACYIFLSVVLIPALTPFGFDVMAVHLFVIYCGLFSFITPPVALAAYVAASIVGADFWKTGFAAMRLGFVKYFVPFAFVFNPALILHGKSPIMIAEAVITAFIGVLLLGSSLEGYLIGVGKLNYLLRAIFGLAGLLTFVPEIYTDMIGLGLAGATYGVIFVRRRSQKQVAIMLQSNTERR